MAEASKPHPGKAIPTRVKPTSTVCMEKNAGECSHRQTFAPLEADSSSDESIEEDDLPEPPPKLDGNAVKEPPRTHQVRHFVLLIDEHFTSKH